MFKRDLDEGETLFSPRTAKTETNTGEAILKAGKVYCIMCAYIASALLVHKLFNILVSFAKVGAIPQSRAARPGPSGWRMDKLLAEGGQYATARDAYRRR
jgi:hypothetical protein